MYFVAAFLLAGILTVLIIVQANDPDQPKKPGNRRGSLNFLIIGLIFVIIASKGAGPLWLRRNIYEITSI
jgi:uncharacterized membrane protein YphA (DoxX/SURF4 family)